MNANVSVESNAQARCVECRGAFPISEMIRHGMAYVCAGCKPIFLQKLAEGAYVNTGEMRYAGFWRRFAAVCVDAILLGAVNMGLFVVILLFVGQTAGGAAPPFTQPEQVWAVLVYYGVALTLNVLYEAVLVAKYGATVGKVVCHVKVVAPEGDLISFPRALGRHFAKYLSSFILLIGYIMAAFDKERRSLHDRICNTRVVLT